MASPKRIVLIDTMALVHRAFHAIPFLATKQGELTNAVFGFTSTVLSVVADLQPDYIAAAFDLPEPTVRHEQFADYKATRQKAPDELRSQFGRVREVIQTLGIPIYERAGFEADDVIGTLAKRASQEHGVEVYVVTGDRDSLQLVSDRVFIYMLKWRPGGRETITYTPALLHEQVGLTPTEFIEYKALVGDTSDNIPGVPGIGEKTAAALIGNYHSLEALYEALEEDPGKHPLFKPKMRENLTTYREQAYLSRDLSRIITDVDLPFELNHTIIHDFDRNKAERLFGDLEFGSLMKRLSEFGRVASHEQEMAHVETVPPERSWDGKNYHIVADEKALEHFLKALSAQEVVAFDTETRELDSIAQNLIGVSFSWAEHEGWYLPFEHASGPTLSLERTLEQLRPLLEADSPRIVAHNLKYDYEVLLAYGIRLGGCVFDTLLGSYLLNPGARTLKLDTLAFQELGESMQPITELIGSGKSQRSLAELSSEEVGMYAAEDAEMTWRLYRKFAQDLRDIGLDTVLENIDLPLVPVIADMEHAGVRLDTTFLGTLGEQFGAELADIEREVYTLTGREFNLNSPAQLAGILFDELKIGKGMTKRGGTHKSTAADQLEKYRDAHPVVPLIMRYRELAKLKSTYVDALPKLIRTDTGRLHTSYNQTVAATGRLSSSDPNLQNIPVRTPQGREIRKAFVADPGFVLFAADYSQFELRIAAHLSGDEALTEAFKSGQDIHAATAAKVSGVDIEDVTSEQRYAAKAVNFSILYGATPHGVARSTGMNVPEATAYIDDYFTTYPKLKRYMDHMIDKAQRDGFVETIFGRRRYLPEIHSSTHPVREAAKRMAINMPVQGTQADILKMAMVAIHRGLGTESERARMILTVHDELVFEIPEADLTSVAPWIIREMESAHTLAVPIVADARVGLNWGEMTPYPETK